MGLSKDNFSLVNEAKKGSLSKTYAGQLLTFFAVFMVSTLVQSIIPCLFVWDEMINAMNNANIDAADSNAVYSFYMNYDFGASFLVLSLFSTIFGIAVTFLYCRGFERRKISSLGFVRKDALKSYFAGAALGFAMFTLSILLCVLLGGGKLGLQSDINIAMILAFLGGFIIQGMYEEVIFRGYFFISTASIKPIGYAIAANSVLFSLAHGLNSGVNLLALFNIALFGVFMSVCMMYTENIWFIGALHSFWNFSQGNLYGVSTSGMNMGASVLEFSANKQAQYLNGGSFGLEGSLVVSFVIIAAIICVLLLYKRKTARKTQQDMPADLRAGE